MNIKEYPKSHHSIGTMMLHLEWCTKYRYKMFKKDDQRNLCLACIRRAASRNGIGIIEISLMPEHVHVVVQISLSISPSKVLQILKGGSAKLFFEKNPKARLRYPKGHLWSRGKFAASLGFIQVDVAQRYVRNQVEHHRGNSTL